MRAETDALNGKPISQTDLDDICDNAVPGVISVNGKVVVDLTPYADAPSGKTGPIPWNS